LTSGEALTGSRSEAASQPSKAPAASRIAVDRVFRVLMESSPCRVRKSGFFGHSHATSRPIPDGRPGALPPESRACHTPTPAHVAVTPSLHALRSVAPVGVDATPVDVVVVGERITVVEPETDPPMFWVKRRTTSSRGLR
jgi:hypothetical protein